MSIYLIDKSVSASPALRNSYTREYFEPRWWMMAHSLEGLLETTRGKRVIVLGMPILNDLKAYDQNPRDDLSPRLRAICRRYGATYLNLLPEFYALGADEWPKLYVSCDGHFTPEGERQVARVLSGNPDYRRAMALNPR